MRAEELRLKAAMAALASTRPGSAQSIPPPAGPRLPPREAAAEDWEGRAERRRRAEVEDEAAVQRLKAACERGPRAQSEAGSPPASAPSRLPATGHSSSVAASAAVQAAQSAASLRVSAPPPSSLPLPLRLSHPPLAPSLCLPFVLSARVAGVSAQLQARLLSVQFDVVTGPHVHLQGGDGGKLGSQALAQCGSGSECFCRPKLSGPDATLAVACAHCSHWAALLDWSAEADAQRRDLAPLER